MTPLAHLFFKLARSHICPRLGNKSNFSFQDVVVVAMLISGKPFDVSSLMLSKMLATVDKSTSGLPYGVWLTKIFEWFKIDFTDAVKVTVKDGIDAKFLNMNNLKIKGEVLSRISLTPQEDPPIDDTTTSAKPVSMAHNVFSQSLHADVAIISCEVTSLRSDTQAIRNDLQAVKAEYQTIKTTMKEFVSEMKTVKKLLLKSVGVTSTIHSVMEDDVGLEELANGAAKHGEDHDTEVTKSDGDLENDPEAY